MPIAHACHACGTALTAVRPRWDLVEHLPVIVCPGCRTPVVRRRPPGLVLWHDARAWARTLLGLAWRAFAAAGLVVVAVGISAGHAHLIDEAGGMVLVRHVAGLEADPDAYDRWVGDDGPTALAVWAGTWLLVGTVLTAGPRHLRRWAGPALFSGAVLGVLGVALAGEWVDRIVAAADSPDAGTVVMEWRPFGLTLLQIGLGAVVALVGVAPGLRLRRALERREAGRFGRARRRVIKRRRTRAWA